MRHGANGNVLVTLVCLTLLNAAGKDLGMRRFPFPQKEIENNGVNVTQARTYLGGADNAATNVWWDKKSK